LTPYGDKGHVANDQHDENFVDERWWKEWRPNLWHSSPPFATIGSDGEVDEGY
jgi:hypothetical protein